MAIIGTFNGANIIALDPTAVTALGALTNVAAVTGPGLLATGWEFPDALVANGCPYLSATSHLPSIKIGGVVKTFTVS